MFASGSKLFDFYHDLVSGGGQYHYDLYVRERSLSNSSWSSSTLLHTSVNVYEIISTTNTYDGKTHIVYEGFNSVICRNYNGTSWSSESTVGDDYVAPRVSSVSNDLFVTWGGSDILNDDFVYLRQYDAAPLTPADFDIDIYHQGMYNYPQLSWDLNNEPDVKINNDSYLVERRTRVGLQPWTNWQQIGYTSGTVSSYIDYTIQTAGSGPRDAEYRIRAKDYNNHVSDYTSSILVEYGDMGMEKRGLGTQSPEIFDLSQNYPNPFNPSTQIFYSLAQDAEVTLRVYDILGTEVAELVNETQTTGNHSITFNFNNLSSGTYIYRMVASKNGNVLFSNTKQMILLK